MSRWTDWVKSWAAKNNTSYGCALSQPECSEEYHKKFGTRKNLPRKKERELMGAEDVNVAEKKQKKQKKRPKLVIEEDEGDEDKESKRKESKERFGMTVEDIMSRDANEMEKLKKTKKKALGEMVGKVGDKKQLAEMARMMGEDYNVQLKPLVKRLARPISQDELTQRAISVALHKYTKQYNQWKDKLMSSETSRKEVKKIGKEMNVLKNIASQYNTNEFKPFRTKLRTMYNELARMFNDAINR